MNRWVKGQAEQDFASWLRTHNAETGAAVGFYGLDVYSLWDSTEAQSIQFRLSAGCQFEA